MVNRKVTDMTRITSNKQLQQVCEEFYKEFTEQLSKTTIMEVDKDTDFEYCARFKIENTNWTDDIVHSIHYNSSETIGINVSDFVQVYKDGSILLKYKDIRYTNKNGQKTADLKKHKILEDLFNKLLKSVEGK